VLLLGDCRKHRTFTPEEITLVQIIANHAACALRLSTSAGEPRVTRELDAAGTVDATSSLQAARDAVEAAGMMISRRDAGRKVVELLDLAARHLNIALEATDASRVDSQLHTESREAA
jgi:GAF domain-containing protein